MSLILGSCHHLTRAVETYFRQKFSNSGFIPLNICFSGLRLLLIRNATLFAKSLSIKDGDVAKDGRLIASGVGQTSRVDALQQAIVKAKAFNFSIEGSVMASDAFFPFPDCVEIAAEAGVVMILQPGGSIKDQESIDMANNKGVGMVTTGIRHFKH